MMDAPLITEAGKVLNKLITVVSDGIGTLYIPRKIRKEADAKAYEIRVIAKAQADADLMAAETAQRIAERITAQETRRQKNIDDITEMAAQELSHKDAVSDIKVDVDWATRFINYAQDISEEEMKYIWAKVLAGEVETPGSFSLRTLDVLRNLSKDEAELFVRVSQFVLYQKNHFIYYDTLLLEKYGIEYIDIARLIEIGLLHSNLHAVKTYDYSPDVEHEFGFIYGRKVIVFVLPPAQKKINVPVVLLSKPAEELMKMVNVEANLDYVKDLVSSIRKLGPVNRAWVSSFLYMDGLGLKYSLPVQEL